MGKVIMIMVDGLRYDTACMQMGYLHHLVEKNLAARFLVKTELPAVSRPMYEVLLTGTAPYVSGITSNDIVRLSKQKSIFHLAREKGLKTAAAAYYFISQLYNHVPYDIVGDREQKDEDNAIQFGKFYFDDSYPDSHLMIDGEILRSAYDPDFLLIHPMGMDYVGHLFGPDSKAYRKQAIELDRWFARFVPGWMENDYHIVITADHGMNSDGLHQGISPDERHVPLFTISSAFQPGCYREEVPQLAIAPMVCKLLNLEPAGEMSTYDISEGLERGTQNPI
ncbi:alkaline phosphatase family protein [Candidatus Formimonas warabiya]|uniref:Nucleotide pyrophosphatase n=1 Tax=Formimonas warabiya TaxID=1761012 RepID=A0A3G1KSI8_FORW1|nr:alkaline phosphatase family protein [Candidatus Formimonas warabiya]ATW25419.1 nucleotide pyrophosphatase [Candidatus Formimonas warabiya]